MKIENGQNPAFIRALTLLAQEPAGRANVDVTARTTAPAGERVTAPVSRWELEREADYRD